MHVPCGRGAGHGVLRSRSSRPHASGRRPLPLSSVQTVKRIKQASKVFATLLPGSVLCCAARRWGCRHTHDWALVCISTSGPPHGPDPSLICTTKGQLNMSETFGVIIHERLRSLEVQLVPKLQVCANRSQAKIRCLGCCSTVVCVRLLGRSTQSISYTPTTQDLTACGAFARAQGQDIDWDDAQLHSPGSCAACTQPLSSSDSRAR